MDANMADDVAIDMAADVAIFLFFLSDDVADDISIKSVGLIS